jgi:hypothetical protein
MDSMKAAKGFKSGAIPHLRPVLQAWLDLQQRYVARSQYSDAAWIYGERASLSMLAAAAWAAGGIALEEFSTDKKRSSEGSSVPVDTSAYGRCDLYIRMKSREYLIEAKPSWPALRGDARSRVAKALSAATKDVKRNSTYKGARRLGAVLIAPHVTTEYVEDSSRLVRTFVEDLQSIERCVAAWFFPRATRRFEVTGDGRSYPGAAVLIRPLRISA